MFFEPEMKVLLVEDVDVIRTSFEDEEEGNEDLPPMPLG